MSSNKSSQVQTVGTINRLIAASVQRNPDKAALVSKVDKQWKPLTFREVETKLRLFSLGLRALGVQRGDCVAVLSENRPEWAIADLAILSMGCVTVPIYPTLPPAQVIYLLTNSGATALVASDAKQLQKAQVGGTPLPGLKALITMEESSAKGDIVSFDHVLKLGETQGSTLTPTFEKLRDSVQPDDLASLVYTSGTTGDPKGAMLTQGNLFAATQIAEAHLPFPVKDEIFLSFLPLCHVFERVTYYLALGAGATTYYAESLFKVQENMMEVKPTLMQSVPRLYEAIYERSMDGIAKAPESRQKMIHWGLEVGNAHSKRVNEGKFISPLLAIQHLIADRLVLEKVRERFGGRFRFLVSGGAPLTRQTAEFFQAVGIPILEGYGLTETTAATTLNPYHRAKIGTVGKAISGVTVKLASDGEILITGPTVMKGYWGHEEATAEVIDSDGWFHSGDIGEIDRDGYVKITDRKKDILVLGNGKKVAPQPIENKLKMSPLISEIVLLGDSAGTVSALVFPNYERLGKWAKDKGLAETDAASLASNADARKAIKAEIDSLSTDLAEFEKIRKIALIEKPLSIENGELTPTLKVKRKVVREKYGHLLD